LNGKMHYRGIYSWPDGRKYEGEYLDDKKDGFGIFTFADGKKYEGYWVDGKQHGIGRYTSLDGSVRWGKWENGKRKEWIADQDEDKVFKIRESPLAPLMYDE
jgi:hypothetical protein